MTGDHGSAELSLACLRTDEPCLYSGVLFSRILRHLEQALVLSNDDFSEGEYSSCSD